MSGHASDSTIGSSVLGRYRVVRKLARGGMGAVYLARTEGAEGFARPVVVKRVLPTLMDDDEVAQMFVREARILSELQHPNIVPVLDFGQDADGAYVMVLDYVNGYHLGQWARYCQKFKGGIACDMVLFIMGRVLEALHYAHTLTRSDGKMLQIIHRDVTPSNVLLDMQGNVKLLDFGIARVSGDETGIITQRPQVKGKLPYLALEIFQGKDPSAASDVYSAGVVLYELLTGTNPFMGRETADIFHKVLNANLASVHAVRDDAPEEIDEVLGRAVNRDPRSRYASAAEFAEALAALRRRSDSVIADDMRKELRQDFQGRMPKELKIEPLSVRDAAWRGPVPGGLSDFPQTEASGPPASMPVTEDLPLPDGALPLPSVDLPTVQADVPEALLEQSNAADQRVTVPPPNRPGGPSQVPGLPPTPAMPPMPPPPAGGLGAATGHDPELDRATLPDPAQPAAAASAGRRSEPRSRGSRPQSRSAGLWIVATVAVAVSAASLWFSLSRLDGGGEREIVVIERQNVPAAAKPAGTRTTAADSQPGTDVSKDAGAAAGGQAGTAPTVDAPVDPPPASAEPQRRAKAAPGPPNPRALTRRFSRKQSQVEACFAKHAKGLEGRPKLAVRFVIDAAGRVKQGELDPAAMAGTPLGKCVLGVARSTRFGAQQREFSFRIPITARVVQ